MLHSEQSDRRDAQRDDDQNNHHKRREFCRAKRFIAEIRSLSAKE